MKRALALAAAIALFFPAISPAQGISTPSLGIKVFSFREPPYWFKAVNPTAPTASSTKTAKASCVPMRCAAAPEDKKPNGSCCWNSGQCESRLCFDFACSAVPPHKKPLGAHCWKPEACESGKCDKKFGNVSTRRRPCPHAKWAEASPALATTCVERSMYRVRMLVIKRPAARMRLVHPLVPAKAVPVIPKLESSERTLKPGPWLLPRPGIDLAVPDIASLKSARAGRAQA